MPFNLSSFLIVAAVLFTCGVFTVLTRRNVIGILMGIELIMNSAGLNFVAFNRYMPEAQTAAGPTGQVFTLFIIVLAAAEVAVALAIVLALYSKLRSIDVEKFHELSG